MLPGPPPVPTAIKRAEGNPGKGKLNDREPQPTLVKATPPRRLTDPAARKLYATFAKELVRFGLLTKLDVADLAEACQLWVDADKLYQQYLCEPWQTHPIRGKEINPALRASLAQRAEARKVFRRFGIGSPAERSRLKVVEPVKKKFSPASSRQAVTDAVLRQRSSPRARGHLALCPDRGGRPAARR